MKWYNTKNQNGTEYSYIRLKDKELKMIIKESISTYMYNEKNNFPLDYLIDMIYNNIIVIINGQKGGK